MKIMVSKYVGVCADRNCGATIQVGQRIKWYGRGKVYGIGCHTKDGQVSTSSVDNEPVNHKRAYGRCEDAPCCGCCGGIDSYSNDYSESMF